MADAIDAGFDHEHQRPDRDAFVTYNFAGVNLLCNPMPTDRTCCNYKSSECCEKTDAFLKFSSSDIDTRGIYDVFSIMHFVEAAYALLRKRDIDGKAWMGGPNWK